VIGGRGRPTARSHQPGRGHVARRLSHGSRALLSLEFQAPAGRTEPLAPPSYTSLGRGRVVSVLLPPTHPTLIAPISKAELDRLPSTFRCRLGVRGLRFRGGRFPGRCRRGMPRTLTAALRTALRHPRGTGPRGGRDRSAERTSDYRVRPSWQLRNPAVGVRRRRGTPLRCLRR
jgi:hypothetical protein